MEQHRIEPELNRDPPRRVRRRGTRGYGTLFSQFFLIPILAMTFFFPLWTVHLALVRAIGPIVSCKIVDRYRKFDKDNDDWLYYLVYRVNIEGRQVTQRELVDEQSCKMTPVGSTAQLQLSPLKPGLDSVLLIPGRGVWGIVWGFAFTSIILLGCAAMLLWYIYILPARRRKLAIRGVPVVGRLVDKTMVDGRRMQAYYFHYEYQTQPLNSAFEGKSANSSPTLRGKQSVRQSDWAKPQIGGLYTILYDPKKPEFSVLYLYGDYVAVD